MYVKNQCHLMSVKYTYMLRDVSVKLNMPDIDNSHEKKKDCRLNLS